MATNGNLFEEGDSTEEESSTKADNSSIPDRDNENNQTDISSLDHTMEDIKKISSKSKKKRKVRKRESLSDTNDSRAPSLSEASSTLLAGRKLKNRPKPTRTAFIDTDGEIERKLQQKYLELETLINRQFVERKSNLTHQHIGQMEMLRQQYNLSCHGLPPSGAFSSKTKPRPHSAHVYVPSDSEDPYSTIRTIQNINKFRKPGRQTRSKSARSRQRETYSDTEGQRYRHIDIDIETDSLASARDGSPPPGPTKTRGRGGRRSPRARSTGSPRPVTSPERAGFLPTDHNLQTSDNPKIREWLKQKNVLMRKLKASDRAKKREKRKESLMKESLREMDRQAGKQLVKEWMARKKREAAQRAREEKARQKETETEEVREREKKKMGLVEGKGWTRPFSAPAARSADTPRDESTAPIPHPPSSKRMYKRAPAGRVRLTTGSKLKQSESGEEATDKSLEESQLSYTAWLKRKREEEKKKKFSAGESQTEVDPYMRDVLPELQKKRVDRVLNSKKKLDTGLKNEEEEPSLKVDGSRASLASRNSHPRPQSAQPQPPPPLPCKSPKRPKSAHPRVESLMNEGDEEKTENPFNLPFPANLGLPPEVAKTQSKIFPARVAAERKSLEDQRLEPQGCDAGVDDGQTITSTAADSDTGGADNEPTGDQMSPVPELQIEDSQGKPDPETQTHDDHQETEPEVGAAFFSDALDDDPQPEKGETPSPLDGENQKDNQYFLGEGPEKLEPDKSLVEESVQSKVTELPSEHILLLGTDDGRGDKGEAELEEVVEVERDESQTLENGEQETERFDERLGEEEEGGEGEKNVDEKFEEEEEEEEDDEAKVIEEEMEEKEQNQQQEQANTENWETEGKEEVEEDYGRENSGATKEQEDEENLVDDVTHETEESNLPEEDTHAIDERNLPDEENDKNGDENGDFGSGDHLGTNVNSPSTEDEEDIDEKQPSDEDDIDENQPSGEDPSQYFLDPGPDKHEPDKPEQPDETSDQSITQTEETGLPDSVKSDQEKSLLEQVVDCLPELEDEKPVPETIPEEDSGDERGSEQQDETVGENTGEPLNQQDETVEGDTDERLNQQNAINGGPINSNKLPQQSTVDQQIPKNSTQMEPEEDENSDSTQSSENTTADPIELSVHGGREEGEDVGVCEEDIGQRENSSQVDSQEDESSISTDEESETRAAEGVNRKLSDGQLILLSQQARVTATEILNDVYRTVCPSAATDTNTGGDEGMRENPTVTISSSNCEDPREAPEPEVTLSVALAEDPDSSTGNSLTSLDTDDPATAVKRSEESSQPGGQDINPDITGTVEHQLDCQEAQEDTQEKDDSQSQELLQEDDAQSQELLQEDDAQSQELLQEDDAQSQELLQEDDAQSQELLQEDASPQTETEQSESSDIPEQVAEFETEHVAEIETEHVAEFETGLQDASTDREPHGDTVSENNPTEYSPPVDHPETEDSETQGELGITDFMDDELVTTPHQQTENDELVATPNQQTENDELVTTPNQQTENDELVATPNQQPEDDEQHSSEISEDIESEEDVNTGIPGDEANQEEEEVSASLNSPEGGDVSPQESDVKQQDLTTDDNNEGQMIESTVVADRDQRNSIGDDDKNNEDQMIVTTVVADRNQRNLIRDDDEEMDVPPLEEKNRENLEDVSGPEAESENLLLSGREGLPGERAVEKTGNPERRGDLSADSDEEIFELKARLRRLRSSDDFAEIVYASRNLNELDTSFEAAKPSAPTGEGENGEGGEGREEGGDDTGNNEDLNNNNNKSEHVVERDETAADTIHLPDKQQLVVDEERPRLKSILVDSGGVSIDAAVDDSKAEGASVHSPRKKVSFSGSSVIIESDGRGVVRERGGEGRDSQQDWSDEEPSGAQMMMS